MAKSKIDGGFVVIPRHTLMCDQWKKLKTGTRAVFLAMLTAYIRDKKANPTYEVKMTHRQLQYIAGVSRPTVVRAIKELVENDFISIVRQGSFSRLYSMYTINSRFLY